MIILLIVGYITNMKILLTNTVDIYTIDNRMVIMNALTRNIIVVDIVVAIIVSTVYIC